MKVTLGIVACLALLPVARADIADTGDPSDTNGSPVAQPVAPAADSGQTPPKAQPVDFPDAPTAPKARPVSPDDSAEAPSDTANTGSAVDAGTPPPPGQPGLIVVPAAGAKFTYATQAYNAGRYADAVRSFTEFLRLFPADRHAEEAAFHLAESYRELGRSKDALAAYTYQVGRFPQGPFRGNAELQCGAILFDQGKFADAIEPLQYAFDHGEGVLKEDAQFLLARAFLATQKEAAGRALLQSLVDVKPPSKLAGNSAQTLAELDDTEKKPADALALWQKAIKLLPGASAQAVAATRGGWSAIAAKQFEVAEELFMQARQLGASGQILKVANTGLLRAVFAEKKYAFWLKADQGSNGEVLASAHEEILYDRGHADFAIKAWPEAVAAFDAFLKEFPDAPGAPGAAYERMLAAIQADPAHTLSECEAFLKTYPQSPFRARVELLQAQELSHEKNFAAAAPIWEKLAAEPAATNWPRREILLERARAYDELKDWPKAASSYRAVIDEGGNLPAATLLSAEARMAIALQNDHQTLAATEAWKAVQAQAPAGSPDQQIALESLGLIYDHAGPAQAALMAQTFRELLDKFPNSTLRGLAAFSVGDYLFSQRDYAGAEPFLLKARTADPKTWNQPATQRLALAAYGRKDWGTLLQYTEEYDAVPGAEAAGPLPPSLFYALAQEAQKNGELPAAEDYYRRVTIAPGAGELSAGAWWQLGQVQMARKDWGAAVTSITQYQQAKPEAKNATSVLLALGRAQLGAHQFEAAKATANQALTQEPQGANSAAARMLLGEVAFASGSYAEAARMFATLAILFDKADTAPQAMTRAADSFEKAGDAKSAADWRAKLQAKYPQFQPVSYL